MQQHCFFIFHFCYTSFVSNPMRISESDRCVEYENSKYQYASSVRQPTPSCWPSPRGCREWVLGREPTISRLLHDVRGAQRARLSRRVPPFEQQRFNPLVGWTEVLPWDLLTSMRDRGLVVSFLIWIFRLGFHIRNTQISLSFIFFPFVIPSKCRDHDVSSKTCFEQFSGLEHC